MDLYEQIYGPEKDPIQGPNTSIEDSRLFNLEETDQDTGLTRTISVQGLKKALIKIGTHMEWNKRLTITINQQCQ